MSKHAIIETDLLLKIRASLAGAPENMALADAIGAAMATPAERVKVSIRAGFARLASAFMPRNDIRYYLNGIIVEPRAEGGAYIIATNGHTLIAIIDPDATCEAPAIIKPNAETIQRLPKLGSKGDLDKAKLRLVEFAGRDELSITDGKSIPVHTQSCDATIDARIIDWRGPIPDLSTLERGRIGTFNASLIAKLGQVAVGSAAPSIEPFQHPENARSVVACRVFARDDILLLVMPMYCEGDGKGWMDQFKAARKPTE